MDSLDSDGETVSINQSIKFNSGKTAHINYAIFLSVTVKLKEQNILDIFFPKEIVENL